MMFKPPKLKNYIELELSVQKVPSMNQNDRRGSGGVVETVRFITGTALVRHSCRSTMLLIPPTRCWEFFIRIVWVCLTLAIQIGKLNPGLSRIHGYSTQVAIKGIRKKDDNPQGRVK
ncbi:unnamed protein product [Angiostrongylus costaricensis]|uniref:Ovule protein n=1 Tax=Angiostrongylus costaricensis TaxID=334426 RepID=A0A0R3PGM1_ANGCS|nr:unnamed protein product [Angiostrongylus costaricensis]